LVSNGKPLLEQQWTDDVWQHFHAQRWYPYLCFEVSYLCSVW
jgi:hypothetical protein